MRKKEILKTLSAIEKKINGLIFLHNQPWGWRAVTLHFTTASSTQVSELFVRYLNEMGEWKIYHQELPFGSSVKQEKDKLYFYENEESTPIIGKFDIIKGEPEWEDNIFVV